MPAAAKAKRRLKEAKSAMYRQLVLEAAEDVFAAKGYDAAKMQDVATAAGISLATLYTVFSGKQELYAAVHAHHGQALLARAASTVADAEDIVDLLVDGVTGYVQYLIENPTYLQMHLREGDAWAIDPKLRSESQAEAFHGGMAMAAQVFEQGIDEGVFVPDEPALMSRIMIATHQVRLANWLANGMAGDTDEMIEKIQHQVVRTFCTPEIAAVRLAQMEDPS